MSIYKRNSDTLKQVSMTPYENQLSNFDRLPLISVKCTIKWFYSARLRGTTQKRLTIKNI